MKTAFMFPGQGAQEVGMGQKLAQQSDDLRQLYRDAGQVLGYDLATLCSSGPAERLDMTDASQPAIFVTSAVCLAALRGGLVAPELLDVRPDACVGLSLGEYTALYASGAMGFGDAVKLVQLRGESMQAAAEARAGAMLSVLGLESEDIEKLCAAVLAEGIVEDDGQPTVLAGVNFNCPGQVVLSGSVKAIQRAEARAEEFGASRAIPLSVAGAFHTEMMAPAAEKLRGALDQCALQTPGCPVLANVDAEVYNGPDDIREKLMRQLVSPVRWQQQIERLLDDGFERFVEIGPGRVLTGLVKKITRARKQKVMIVTVNGQ